MKLSILLAFVAALAVGCIGNRPVTCACLKIIMTGGANNTPITDAEIWVIDDPSGPRPLPVGRYGNTYLIGDVACLTTEHRFEVRRPGYVSQQFTHRSLTEIRSCDPPPPPNPVVNIHLVEQ
jgi:hypothetical protein